MYRLMSLFCVLFFTASLQAQTQLPPPQPPPPFVLKWGAVRSPLGVAVDGSGNVYVADTNNRRIQLFGAPALLPVEDIAVNAGESKTITAVNQSGRGIDLSLDDSSAPSVLSFTDNGDGTGTVTVNNDVPAGVYGPFTIIASDRTNPEFKDTDSFYVKIKGLISEYRAEDNFKDETDNHFNGTGNGDVSFVSGPFGKACVFRSKVATRFGAKLPVISE